MDSKRILFFDFDGVIVDTYRMSLEIHQKENATLDEVDFRKYFEGNVNDTMEEERKKHPGVSILNFFSKYRRGVFKYPVVSGMAEVLHELSSLAPLIVVSSTQSSIIAEYTEYHGIRKYFLEILGNDVHPSKIEKFKMMMAKYAVSPMDCLYVTDTLGDIREAREAGIESIAVLWGYHPKETLEIGKPLAIVSNPSEITEAARRYFESINK